jgi:hypothetical protein
MIKKQLSLHLIKVKEKITLIYTGTFAKNGRSTIGILARTNQ